MGQGGDGHKPKCPMSDRNIHGMGQNLTMTTDVPTTNAVLESFGGALNIAVFGAHGGIGQAFVSALSDQPHVAHLTAISRIAPDLRTDTIRTLTFDLRDEASIADAAAALAANGPLHLAIVATGVLHDETHSLRPERSWRSLDADSLLHSYHINAVGPALIAKHVLPLLDKERKAGFAALSARVGSIGDNRLGGWHAYRASKAALNQIIRTLSVELARKNPTAFCVGLHPGTVNTNLSQPFQANVPEKKLFDPAFAAHQMLSVLNGLTHRDSGRCFAWDGQPIPP